MRELERDRRCSDYVFVGQCEGTPLSNIALLIMPRRMKRGDITAHRFRPNFSDWASAVSSFSPDRPRAHDPNKAERAYRRGDARENGIEEAWANWRVPKA